MDNKLTLSDTFLGLIFAIFIFSSLGFLGQMSNSTNAVIADLKYPLTVFIAPATLIFALLISPFNKLFRINDQIDWEKIINLAIFSLPLINMSYLVFFDMTVTIKPLYLLLAGYIVIMVVIALFSLFQTFRK